MKSAPFRISYFSQGESVYIDWSWLDREDLSWIDRLNGERAKERAKHPDFGVTFHSSDLKELSKDFSSVDFPPSHEWPDEFRSKYHDTIKNNTAKIKEMVASADEVVEVDNCTIYLDCADGYHYFSTPCFNYGSIEVAAIDDDSSFDSAETAVYAFVNDYRDWEEDHGETYRKAEMLSGLESLREPVPIDYSDCQHEDLGSLGYRHGDIVICPHCGKRAEVW